MSFLYCFLGKPYRVCPLPPPCEGRTRKDLFPKHEGHPSGKDCAKDEPMRKRYCNIHDAPAFAIMARALGVAVT